MTKFLNENDFEEIRSFVYRNARPLELALWQYHFEKGNKENVLSALLYYQNDDGGFGKAIEPDNWNPESTPYAANFAIEMLRRIDFTEIEHPLYQGVIHYLENTTYQGYNGWFFSVPDNDVYPHAIWWQYNHEGNEKNQNIGITASLSGFILRYLNSDSKLYGKAMKYTDMLFDRLKSDDSYGDMGIGGYCDLFSDLQAAGLHDRFDLSFLEDKTRALIQKRFHEYRWDFHQDMAGVLPNPSVYYYSGYEQAVSDALDELIEIRPKNGVWDIPWQWYDGGKYAKEFAISENWWKSSKAIEKLLFLKAYGRLRME
jgi:hypothetical protein